MTEHRITHENAKVFVGRKVHITYGAYFPTNEGNIIGTCEINGTPLVLIFTDEGHYTHAGLLYENGFNNVGFHLLPENKA